MSQVRPARNRWSAFVLGFVHALRRKPTTLVASTRERTELQESEHGYTRTRARATVRGPYASLAQAGAEADAHLTRILGPQPPRLTPAARRALILERRARPRSSHLRDEHPDVIDELVQYDLVRGGIFTARGRVLADEIAEGRA